MSHCNIRQIALQPRIISKPLYTPPAAPLKTRNQLIESHNAEHEAGIEIRQIKYLNNIVEQDHPAIKRLVRPVQGFKSFRSAAVTLAGIELMHMIRKGQLPTAGEMCPARQFYSLAG
jgi:putative transposase